MQKPIAALLTESLAGPFHLLESMFYRLAIRSHRALGFRPELVIPWTPKV